ncbi:unnamed protein product [Colias eurytheme]|nr:unnamed protein product [Colias eurytheme]
MMPIYDKKLTPAFRPLEIASCQFYCRPPPAARCAPPHPPSPPSVRSECEFIAQTRSHPPRRHECERDGRSLACFSLRVSV